MDKAEALKVLRELMDELSERCVLSMLIDEGCEADISAERMSALEYAINALEHMP